MSTEIVAFNPQMAQTGAARFERSAAWGDSSSMAKPPTISTDKGLLTAFVDGQQIGQRVPSLDVVILAQFPPGRDTGRSYFEGIYDPSKTGIPTCASNDGKVPAANAKAPQSASCATCPKNAIGSGALAGTRACRYGKTLAVAVPAMDNKVFALKISAQGIFAKTDAATGASGLLALDAQLGRMVPQEVITRLSFPEGSTGGLRFTPVAVLPDAHAAAYVAMSEGPEVKAALRAPDEANEAPAPAAALPMYQPPAPVHQAPPAPVYQAPVYQAPPAPVYQAPPAPVYQAPPAPAYQAPPAPVYAPPPAPVYAPPAPPAGWVASEIAPVPKMETVPVPAVPAPVLVQATPAAPAGDDYSSRLSAAFNI